MKKTIIVNIPMAKIAEKVIYKSDDSSLPVVEKEYSYPVIPFLEATSNKEDDIKIILLVKHSPTANIKKQTELFINEIEEANSQIGAKINYHIIESEFSEKAVVHEKLMRDIVNILDSESHIIADITYGPKDLPIVLFAALNFAEKFLKCEIDNIVYGQGFFSEAGKLSNTKICDLSPLYSLNSLTNTIKCDNPEKAKELLDTIIKL